MIDPKEIRKLAAVMFTDLEGYTSMFQKNEPSALDKITIHRQYLEKITSRFHGQIIQFYGDGSLVVFDSVMDAIRSAIEIQQASKEWQIPVRIGLHIGDVIFKDNDIFGDAVNVASRIQTVGVPGSIVVSRKVADEIKNQPDIGTIRLGQYSLKNVEERFELYAITGQGLITPPAQKIVRKKTKTKLYFLLAIGLFFAYTVFINPFLLKSNKSRVQEEQIVIPYFKNLTSNPQFDKIGLVASGIMTYDLRLSSKAHVVSVPSLMSYTDGNTSLMNVNSTLARQTGASIVIEGAYALTGPKLDSLVFYANITDIKTNKILFNIPKINCDSAAPMLGIKLISNAIRGYWNSKGGHLFRYPNYDASVAFFNAQKLWADPDFRMSNKAKEYLIESIRFDSNFLDAYFLLLDAFNNKGEFNNERDTLLLIKKRFPKLEPREENYLKYYEHDLNGNYLEAYRHFIKEYTNDPKDFFVNTSGMVMAVEYLNDPLTALKFNQDINMDNVDLDSCAYCRTRIDMAMQANIDLSNNAIAGKLAARLKPYAGKSGQATRLIAYFMNANDTSSVNDIIQMASRDTAQYKDNFQFYCLMAAQYAMLNGQNQLRDEYVTKAIRQYGSMINLEKGRCYYLKGEYQTAESIFNALIREKPSRNRYAFLGLVYARRGEKEKANDVISKLGLMNKDWDFGQISYCQGRIKAVMGENQSAIQYLSTALDEGIKFQPGSTFQHDPDLMGLNNDPKYLALLTRNRQK